MFKPLAAILKRVVVHGNLTIITADGVHHTFGDGTGRPICARLASRHLEWRLALDPQLAVGEAYMDGQIEMRTGEVYDLLDVIFANATRRAAPAWTRSLDRARYLGRRIAQFNPAARSQRNVRHHYDIDGAIYDLFLDRRRQYSCAYFPAGTTDLDMAQLAKLDHIAAKLDLADGQRILDIGSGWGGLAVHLASLVDAKVEGVTLSEEQLAGSRMLATAQGLDGAVQFHLKDYRHVDGSYDRIVSVGMFEHVGVNHYGKFFRKVRDLLADDGVALIHFIGRSDRPTITNPFIARYIFPGGYIPALSEVLPAIERSGLIVTDIEILRRHYADTLRLWRQRFRARWDEAQRIRDERFCRMWEFYLAGSETAFRYQNLVVFQIQLTRRPDRLPVTRDYIGVGEQHFARERAVAQAPQPRRLAGE